MNRMGGGACTTFWNGEVVIHPLRGRCPRKNCLINKTWMFSVFDRARENVIFAKFETYRANNNRVNLLWLEGNGSIGVKITQERCTGVIREVKSVVVSFTDKENPRP